MMTQCHIQDREINDENWTKVSVQERNYKKKFLLFPLFLSVKWQFCII